MKEIKSVRVRPKFSSGDDNRGLGDYKVTLYDNGRRKFKVAAGQIGRPFMTAEYRKEDKFENYTDDDFIKDGINILVSKQNNNKEFEIIQDPWLENAPKWRSFGFDPYYLNNGSELTISWLDNNTSAGGKKWSDDNGNELEVPRSVSIQQETSVSKGNITKIVSIRSPESYTGTNKVLKVTSFGIESVTDKAGNVLSYSDEQKYSGLMLDSEIIKSVIFDWNSKVPNYNLSLCEPSFRMCEIVPYISPVEELEKIEEKLEVTTTQPTSVAKEKLNIIIPKDLQLKVKQDFSFKIFVGDPPKTELPVVDGFNFGDEDDLSNLLLEDEFREVEFDAEEESPSNLIEIPPEETKKEHAGESISGQDVFIPGKDINSFILPKTYSNTKKQGFNLLNSGWIGNLIKSAKIHVGSPTYDIPFTDNGNLGCAAGVSIIFYRAFGVSIINGKPVKDNPTSISSFGSLGTLDLNNAFKNNPNLYQKRNNWRDAKPGDIINTSRGRKSGHIGIVIDEKSSNGSWVVISNSSKGFEGGGGGAIKRNYSIKAWESVATRNPTETFTYYYIGPTLSGNSLVI